MKPVTNQGFRPALHVIEAVDDPLELNPRSVLGFNSSGGADSRRRFLRGGVPDP